MWPMGLWLNLHFKTDWTRFCNFIMQNSYLRCIVYGLIEKYKARFITISVITAIVHTPV